MRYFHILFNYVHIVHKIYSNFQRTEYRYFESFISISLYVVQGRKENNSEQDMFVLRNNIF